MALLGIVTVLLEYIDRLIPIMLALCSMLLVTYYAFNYAGIIGWGLCITYVHTCICDTLSKKPTYLGLHLGNDSKWAK